jgi:hypothetical protein
VARRLAEAAPAVLLAVLALAACGGSSTGLVVLGGEGGGSFDLQCGITANWEAGVVGNTSNDTAVVTFVRLRNPPAGFSLEWARAKLAEVGAVQESNADRQLLGLRIPPAGDTVPDHKNLGSATQGWHFAVGIHTPRCEPRSGSRHRNVAGPTYQLPEGELAVGYRLGDENRTLRIGGEQTVCTHPHAGACP